MKSDKKKVTYEHKVEALEQKNSDLKLKLEDYQLDGKEKWEGFKSEFSNNMEEFGKSFKNLKVDNVQ